MVCSLARFNSEEVRGLYGDILIDLSPGLPLPTPSKHCFACPKLHAMPHCRSCCAFVCAPPHVDVPIVPRLSMLLAARSTVAGGLAASVESSPPVASAAASAGVRARSHAYVCLVYHTLPGLTCTGWRIGRVPDSAAPLAVQAPHITTLYSTIIKKVSHQVEF